MAHTFHAWKTPSTELLPTAENLIVVVLQFLPRCTGCPQGPASVGRVCDSRPHTRCPNLTKVRRNKSWGRIDFGRYFSCTSDNLTARIMCAWSSAYFKTYLDLSLLKRSRHRPARLRETLPDILCLRHPMLELPRRVGTLDDPCSAKMIWVDYAGRYIITVLPISLAARLRRLSIPLLLREQYSQDHIPSLIDCHHKFHI